MTLSSIRFLALSALAASSATAFAIPEWKSVEPVLKTRCYDCHGGEKTKGDVDLKRLSGDPKITTEFALWQDVKDTVDNGDMPPKKAHQLTDDERITILGWVNGSLDALAQAKAGDPGPVTMRRLTNAEYDYSIRDLTGRDYGLAKEFQTDGGGGEGFANTGDVLFVSPQGLDKYFSAARKLADFATILPGTGIQFQAQRVGLRGQEQMKAQAQQGLYVWYQQKAAPFLPKDFEDMHEADYMLACWKHRHFKTPLDQLAKETKLNIHFLNNWATLLDSTEPKSRFLDLTRVTWRELPGPDAAKPGQVPQPVVDRINTIRDDMLSWNNPKRPGEGTQRHQQDADGIRPYNLIAYVGGKPSVYLCVGDDGDGNKGDIAQFDKFTLKTKKGWVKYPEWLKKQLGEDRKAVAATPPPANAEALKKRIADLERVTALFGKHPQGRPVEPTVIAVAAPQVIQLPMPENTEELRAEGRLDLKNPDIESATIQWVFDVNKPRDVTKIMPGVLTVWKINTPASRQTMNDFNVMKTAFPDMYERRLEQVASNLYRNKPNITVYYFSDEQLGQLLGESDRRLLERMKMDYGYTVPPKLNKGQTDGWDQLVSGHLVNFAAAAWRRSLTEDERKQLVKLYQDGIAKELDRESAAREVIVRVLVSPNFLFKAETLPVASAAPKTTNGEIPLSATEIASRLSYFLWASIPDAELRKAAEDGSLLKPEVLAAQTKRMLRDPRSEALAKEFAGQWLKFNGFNLQSNVDEKKYPEFTPELREDMQREAIEFFANLIRNDRSVGDIVTGDYSFLNERLAKHYGVPNVQGNEFREVKVADYHRGGLLGMGAVLTKTSRPNRTSPVVRGDFLYQVVLGFSSPPPPPNVPKLPEGAVKPATLREALQQHRVDKACAVCHDRIDPLGFSLEHFDPIGRFRSSDDAGDKIDDLGIMKDGTKVQGIDGLRQYLKGHQAQITGQFCRKLLGYSLGRQTMPSDKALMAKMQETLNANGNKFSAAVLTIVNSRQFLNRRSDQTVAGNP